MASGRSAMEKAAEKNVELRQRCVATGTKERLADIMELKLLMLKHEIDNMENFLRRASDKLPNQFVDDMEEALSMWSDEAEKTKELKKRLDNAPTC